MVDQTVVPREGEWVVRGGSDKFIGSDLEQRLKAAGQAGLQHVRRRSGQGRRHRHRLDLRYPVRAAAPCIGITCVTGCGGEWKCGLLRERSLRSFAKPASRGRSVSECAAVYTRSTYSGLDANEPK
jgi:hypothetical protein